MPRSPHDLPYKASAWTEFEKIIHPIQRERQFLIGKNDSQIAQVLRTHYFWQVSMWMIAPLRPLHDAGELWNYISDIERAMPKPLDAKCEQLHLSPGILRPNKEPFDIENSLDISTNNFSEYEWKVN